MSKLAICGGVPVKSPGIPGWPRVTQNDRDHLTQTLVKNDLSGVSESRDFEKKFAAMYNTGHCFTVANGTVALELIIRSMGIGYGDEIILPPYTFIATLSSVIFTGAKPVFADIDPGTGNLSAAAAEKKITSKTKAIIAVAIGGRSPDIDAFDVVAKKHGIKLIIDAAQGVGSRWNGRSICCCGDAVSISCQNSKNLTCGEGGIICTGDDILASRLSEILSGYSKKTFAGITQENRIGAYQASVLSTQLDKVNEEMYLREKNAAYLDGQLRSLPFAEALFHDERVTHNAYHLYLMRFKSEVLAERGINRDMFISTLNAEGIEFTGGYAPLYTFPCVSSEYTERIIGSKIDISELPECEKLSKLEGAWLYHSVLLGTRSDMDDIIDALNKIWENTDELKEAIK